MNKKMPAKFSGHFALWRGWQRPCEQRVKRLLSTYDTASIRVSKKYSRVIRQRYLVTTNKGFTIESLIGSGVHV